jgi:hypothetical protein
VEFAFGRQFSPSQNDQRANETVTWESAITVAEAWRPALRSYIVPRLLRDETAPHGLDGTGSHWPRDFEANPQPASSIRSGYLPDPLSPRYYFPYVDSQVVACDDTRVSEHNDTTLSGVGEKTCHAATGQQSVSKLH